MLISRSMIDRFFAGKCSPEEAEQVATFLAENPGVADELLAADWQEDQQLTAEEADAILYELKKLFPVTETAHKKIPLYKRWAIAASLLVAAATGYLLFLQNRQAPVATAARQQTELQWIIQSNITAKLQPAILEDGSTVQLQPAAFIKHHSFAGMPTRDVYLSGEAIFEVAKDRTKPFTVYAGGIATTALGTKFHVVQTSHGVTVQLYEGKVRIAATAALKGWLQKELFLQPGQEFVYRSDGSLFTVQNIRYTKEAHTAKTTVSAATDKNIVTFTTGNWYMFNNQPLPHVFEQLEELYNVRIDYNRNDFSNAYFIGRFEKTDSLEQILNNIAVLKKLRVHHTGNRYIITRKKP